MHPHLQRLLKALRQYSQPLAAIVEVWGVEPQSKQASNKHQTTTINFKELPTVARYFCQQGHLQKAGRRIYFEHYLKPIFGRGLNLIAKPPALRNMPTVLRNFAYSINNSPHSVHWQFSYMRLFSLCSQTCVVHWVCCNKC